MVDRQCCTVDQDCFIVDRPFGGMVDPCVGSMCTANLKLMSHGVEGIGKQFGGYIY